MHKLYLADDRGRTKTDDLNSFHSFSFAEYYDSLKMGFGPLRVINDDVVKAGGGFPTHPHKNMEIISIVLEGALHHTDNLGNDEIIPKDSIQKMTAGTGILHSEFNDSLTDPLHFLQIWVIPDTLGLDPSYEQKKFSLEEKRNKFCLLVSPSGRNGSLKIHQSINIYQSVLDKGKMLSYQMEPQKYVWIQITAGSFYVNNETFMEKGDGVAVWGSNKLLQISSQQPLSSFLLFEMPA